MNRLYKMMVNKKKNNSHPSRPQTKQDTASNDRESTKQTVHLSILTKYEAMHPTVPFGKLFLISDAEPNWFKIKRRSFFLR